MRSMKLGAVAALIVLSALALLWITDVMPDDQIRRLFPRALAGIAIVVLAGIVLSALRGTPQPDETDKRVP